MEGTNPEASAGSWGNVGPDWDVLENVLAELALADMASKSQLLRSLSSFLSSVVATMSLSASDCSVSARVGGVEVTLEQAEICQLNDLLDRELKSQIYFCSALSWTGDGNGGPDLEFSQTLHLDIVSQTVRCCIRILPLLDCISRIASLTSAKLLDGLLQQLCSPARLFYLLGLDAPHRVHDRHIAGRCCQKAKNQVDEPHCSRQFSDPVSFDKSSSESRSCDFCATVTASRHRQEMIFALLEVFMDELLLRPDLTARLLSPREGVQLFGREEDLLSSVKHAEAALAAAFVHVLVSLHSLPESQTSYTSRKKGFLVCNLSLPAGVLLLEKFCGEEIPPFYIAQVVRFLSRVLNDTTPLDFGYVDEMKKKRRSAAGNYEAGGVDWSYCSKERLFNVDLNDRRSKVEVLDAETTLNFAASILEQTILLYTSFSSSADTVTAALSSTPHLQEQSSVLLNLSLSKYHPLFHTLCQNFKLNLTDVYAKRGTGVMDDLNSGGDQCRCSHSGVTSTHRDFVLEFDNDYIGCSKEHHHIDSGSGIHCPSMAHQCCTCSQTTTKYVAKEEEIGEVSILVAALLQLMSCALECIGREVSKLTWLNPCPGHILSSGQATSVANSSEGNFDKILHCVGLYLSLCSPSDGGVFFNLAEAQLPISQECNLGSQSLLHLVGQTIMSFTDTLQFEVQRGAADGILEEYFHLLESLVALLLALDERDKIRYSSTQSGPHQTSKEQCERFCRHDGILQLNSASMFLEAMVLSLQGILHELPKQQRCMPEFLLHFLLKQISKADGLSFVVSLFSNCLKTHLTVQHTGMHNDMIFQSGSLVKQMLHVASSEPTRSRPFFTFVAYTVHVLQDLMPITAALNSSEIVQLVSCYENIAYSLTLACQLAVCEWRVFLKSGHEFFVSLLAKLCEGIERLIAEATAVDNWLCDQSETVGSNSPERPCLEQENCTECKVFLRQVDLLRKALEALANTAECPRRPKLAALFVKREPSFQEVDLQDSLGSLERTSSITSEKKSISPTTIAIIKRLKRKRLPSKKASAETRGRKERPGLELASILPTENESDTESFQLGSDYDSAEERDGPSGNSENWFVDYQNEMYPGKDKFDDLKDWIIPKKGRDYSHWLKRQTKVRQRLHSKNFLKRLQEKRNLLLLLGS